MIYNLSSEEDTIKVAEIIAKKSKIGDVITLTGELGSGKTFFANAFINYFLDRNGMDGVNVTSPTFNLLKIYNVGNFDIYHFDLYRIKDKKELLELDFDSAFANISLIEWPEIASDFLPKKFVKNIKITIGADGRILEVENSNSLNSS